MSTKRMYHKLICGDAKDKLRGIPDGSVDVVFLDPPYGVGLLNDLHRPEGGLYSGAGEEKWDNLGDRDSALAFIDWYLAEAQRVVKDKGTVWVMGTYHNIHDVGSAMLDCGYWILNDVIWVKPNATPQFAGVRFAANIECLIWARAHGKGSYYFDYQAMKQLNGGKQMRADWTIPVCRGKERLVGSDGKVLHKTQKPLELMRRMVLSSVPLNGIMLDFMAGVGTTGIAAAELGRSSIMIEREQRYNDATIKRFADSGYELEVL